MMATRQWLAKEGQFGVVKVRHRQSALKVTVTIN